MNIETLKAQMKKIVELRTAEAQAAAIKTEAYKELEIAENEMVQMLIDAQLPNFRSEHGLASVSYRTSVKTPKTPEDKAAFYAYLKEKGLYDQMISVNSATLNSFFKDALETAKREGKDDFVVPGLGEVTVTPNLSFRK